MPCSYKDQALLKLLLGFGLDFLLFGGVVFFPVKAELPSGLGVPRGTRVSGRSGAVQAAQGGERGGKQQRVTQRAWERVYGWSLVRAVRK